MKNLFKLFISLLLIVGIYPKTHAYEVYEHNMGDENHLVSKKKVMGGQVAEIGYYGNNIEIKNGDVFDISINIWQAGDLKGIIEFDHDRDNAYVRYMPGCVIICDDYNTLKVEYLPSGAKKLYKITVTTNEGETIVKEGIPSFYKKKGYSKEIIGSEKSIGVQPVFLEWLEHWAKKKKFKDYNKLY